MNKINFEFKLQAYQHAADLPVKAKDYGEPAVNFIVWLDAVAQLIADASLVTSDVRVELQDNARWARINWSTDEGDHTVTVQLKNRGGGWRANPQGWCFQFGTPDRTRHGGVGYYGPSKTRNIRLSKTPVLVAARDYVFWSDKRAIAERENADRVEATNQKMATLGDILQADGIECRLDYDNSLKLGTGYSPYVVIKYAQKNGYSIDAKGMPGVVTLQDTDAVIDRVKLMVSFRNQWRAA